ncbi:MAG: hypothetical protein K8F91_16045, partial [Candidatus Obscuribacterales bacterium]|nr:hypothetical protein [Candidatus Obscuribacterales bacterium]
MPHRGFYKLCQLKTAAILFVIIIGLVSATPGALAADAGGDADTQQGIKLFNEKKYGPAILAFGRALKRKPKDPGLFYLLGACYDQGGDRNTAKKFFSYAVQYGPGTKGGSLASQALAKLDPQYQMKLQAGSGQGASTSGLKQQVGSGQGASASGLKQQTGLQGTGSRASSVSASASQASDVSGLPREDRVYYTSMGQHQIVDAAVNNRRIQMLFDTGAEVCAFGKNHLEELQIPIPANARTGYA